MGRGRYGDLRAADRLTKNVQRDGWLGSRRLAVANDVRLRAAAGSICEDRRTSMGLEEMLSRASSWPVGSQRRRRAALQRGGSGVVVMRCRP